MAKKIKILLLILLPLAVIAALVVYLSSHNIAVLDPAGQIARKQRQLIFIGLGLSAIVVLPVYGLTIMIAIKYREGNKKPAKYKPDWDHSRVLETIWWGVPIIIIAILSVITWTSSHALDPYKPIASTTSALPVEVVALDWKWLFIYPNQGVASVNRLEMPLNTPVDFYLTSDTVMNSFWIPSLGGQIYAMPGMTTQLHLIANKPGSYYGSSANISGSGFAGMNFRAVATSQTSFNAWLAQAKSSDLHLNMPSYNQLDKHSFNNPVSYYSNVDPGLFGSIVAKYMAPGATSMSMGMAQ